LIVGTPRSGTTLVQRLACELDGVGVPPETHFLRLFASGLIRRRHFPLEGEALRDELRVFASLDTSCGLQLNPDVLAARLDGRVGTVMDLYSGITRHLAGEPKLCGEKTPSHLRWWRPLCRRARELRLIGVVRDPRDVVASYYDAWGARPHAVLAERWAIDQRELLGARQSLGAGRCVVLRYEDMVQDPAGARLEIARLLGTRPAPATVGGSSPLYLSWEHWKRGTEDPVSDDRVERWRTTLCPEVAAEIAAIAGAPMRAFGYRDRPARRPRGSAQWLRYRYRGRRLYERALRAILTARPSFG
jgi:hypothetical protein